MQETQVEEKKKKAEGRFSSELFSWGESLMAVLIFFVVVFTFFVRLIGVDGSSMYPTLQDRDVYQRQVQWPFFRAAKGAGIDVAP